MTEMHQLACLADLPELAGDQEAPKSRITLMRLGRFKHPKFGAWNITRETFASFLANFASQGRVPIDLDHAPEKGGSTEAAGWISNLEVLGDELYGDVEWTTLGADAIRSHRYAFISPTWSFDGRDAHGARVGPKLIGAGLTNRPFFDLPALNLAAESQSGELWIEPDANFAEHWPVAVRHGIKPRHQDLYEAVWRKNGHLHASERDELKIVEAGRGMQRKYWDVFRAEPGAVTAAGPAGPVVFSPPDDLDSEGERLHADVVAFAAEHGISDFMAAFASLTCGHGAHPDHPPLRQFEIPADVPDEEAAAVAAVERSARALAEREDIDWVDAGAIVELEERIAEAEAEDGFAASLWLDTSRAQVAEPWRDEHYQRDLRRAATIEWSLQRDEWSAGAEIGRDVVHDRAVELRASRVAELREARDRELADAKVREARRRKQAIDDELARRARERLGG